MLKAVRGALVPGLRLFDVAVVALPLSVAIPAWLAERPRPSAAEALGTAIMAAVALAAASVGMHRLRSARTPRPSLGGLARPGVAGRGGSRKGDRPVQLEGEAAAAWGAPSPRALEAQAPPANVRRPVLVLDQLRDRMDHVSYTPGTPNVLSMTKYLHDDGVGRAAGAAARDLASDASATVSRDASGGPTVLRIQGVLDAVAVPRIRPAIEALIAERPPSITVDFSSLRLIDSSGVGLIVGLFKRCRTFGGAVQVSGLKDQPLAIFRLLRLDRIFVLS